MSTLSSLATRLQQLAIGPTRPDRDALAAERDQLRAAPPPAPASTLALPERPADRCRCADCLTRERDEDATRAAFFGWMSRLRAVEVQLYRLTFGTAADDETKDERDGPGRALVELRHDLLAAFDGVRRRGWERRVEFDGRGRPTKAWETAGATAEVLAELIALHRATETMAYLPARELVATIERARNRMGALLVQPLKAPLDPEVAAKAGTEPGPASPAEEHGLVPAPSPNTLDGTIRFRRRGRA
jgi:hypothetical protein